MKHETHISDPGQKRGKGEKNIITVTGIRNMDYAAYDEVWAIVRSLKNPGRMEHVPELSSSWNLFKKYLQLRETGQWDTGTQKHSVIFTHRYSCGRCRVQRHGRSYLNS